MDTRHKPSKPRVIFRPYITTKDGRKIWAKAYGKRAFAIPVEPDDHQPDLPGLD